MLESIQKLRDSLTEQQLAQAKRILSEDQYRCLEEVLSATDDDVQEKVNRLRESMKKTPANAVRLFLKLSADQKAMIKDII